VSGLVLRGVRAGYGRVEVLHGVDLVVPEGCAVALLGVNGVGKTTTLRAISGSLRVSHGTIELDGERLDNRRPHEIASLGVVLIPEGRGIFPGLTVSENLRVANRRSNGDSPAPWHEWLDRVGERFPRLVERLEQRAGSLSGGEQQMLALCRALAGEPRVLLLDELSMGLAPIVMEGLFQEITHLRDEGRTILLVEQYPRYALSIADVAYVMEKGTIVWAGEPHEVRRHARAAPYFIDRA
jgi:branched-chain amino acid transport system ATP-binding protein